MKFISYAQNLEDVILWRALSEVERGFYIDIGAAWPSIHSVTLAFYNKGWSGINIEPNPKFAEELRSQRCRDTNLPIAVGDKRTEKLLNVIDGTGLSTLDPTIACKHKESGWEYEEMSVDVRTLEEIISDYVEPQQDIHFVKIDVEGYEDKVIKGNDWNRYRPWIVVVEATLPLSKSESYFSWEPMLLDSNYIFAYADGLNRFYVSKENEHLLEHFKYPPNVFDDYILAEHFNAKDDIAKVKEEADELRRQLEGVKGEKQRIRKELLELDKNSRKELFELQNLISSYENSISWKLTKPLRSFNPIRLVRYTVRALGRFIMRDAKFAYRLKSFLEPHPRIWRWLKNTVIFDGAAYGEDGFIYLPMESEVIAFSKGPLEDTRGIGRVSRELLTFLRKNTVKKEVTDAEKNSAVHFYSSIHWCPDSLPARSVVMIHDVIPLLFPGSFPEVVKDWEQRYRAIALRADLIITISQSSANDIVRLLGVENNRIKVIPNGVKSLPSDVITDFKLPNDPYFVFFGSHDHHKNVEVLLKAFQSPYLSDILLVMIGDNEPCKKRAEELGVRDRVHFLGRLDDKEAGFVIRNAVGLLFPSLYEGFGLPPLEAALIGTPSVCSRRPAMTELLEGVAMFVDPEDPLEWAEAVRRLKDDGEFRSGLADKAQSRVSQYTWEESGMQLINVLSVVK